MPLSERTALFFDLDRTLWDFERNSLETLKGLFADFALAERGGGDFAAFNDVYQRENAQCWSDYRQGKMKKEVLRSERFKRALKGYGVEDSELAEKLGWKYVERGPHQRHLIPGSLEVLEALKNRGHEIHILTNGFSEVQHIKVKNTGISEWIDQLLTSEELGHLKPARACFDAALACTGVRKEQAWMIGDDHEADVIGAHKAGWKTVFFSPDDHAESDSPASATVGALQELLAVLP
jgi:putative hydrolase of the HAD superfamily